MLSHKELYLFFLLFIIGCASEQSKIDELKLSVEGESNLSLSSICDSVMTVSLKTHTGQPIAQIDKLLIIENLIYILDREILETLFVFDLSGNLQFQLETGPGGPMEFTSLDDFTTDHLGNIFILNNDQRKIFLFDMNGRFQNTISLPDFSHSIEFHKNSIFVYRNNIYQKNDEFQNNQIIRLTLNGEILASYLPITKESNYLSFHESFKPFYSNNENLIFSQALNDTIYEFSSGKFRQLAIINFESKSLRNSPDILQSVQNFSESPKRVDSEYLMGSPFLLDQLIGSIFFAGRYYNYLFFSDPNKEQAERYSRIIDDKWQFPFFHIDFTSNKYLVTSLPFEFLYESNSLSDNDQIKELLRKSEDHDQNPVLILYSLKSN